MQTESRVTDSTAAMSTTLLPRSRVNISLYDETVSCLYDEMLLIFGIPLVSYLCHY